MAPSCPWWRAEAPRGGTPVVVTMENPDNWLISDVTNNAQGFELKGNPSRRKNAKQLTWVLLLRAHRAAGCLASLAAALRRRVSSHRSADDEELELPRESPALRRRFYAAIKIALLSAIALLAVEILAFLRPVGVRGAFDRVHASWVAFRIEYLVPPLQFLANLCVVLFLIQSADRLVLCLGCFWIRFRGIRPSPRSDLALVDGEYDGKGNTSDIESGDGDGYFPMVLVQIPMCNEKEVYQQSIAAVCSLDWPNSKILIQVLDDSDDLATQGLIKEEVRKWKQAGVNIVYRHRVIREGYKAGNLKSAMSCSYVKDYELVAIFDADFQPNPDFLRRTVPHFKGNNEVGLVQARWSYVNKDENLLTRMQNINLCFHFEVEQQVNGLFLNFFGFNGTAGIWRIKALDDAGGWMERTTVEDMDIAVRAHLKGWKFVYLNDVECQCELPESYEAYRKQQHRWHSGPMQLFRLCFPDIIRSKIGFWKKSNLILLFFLLRKLVLPFYSFTLFCIILPMTMFIPEAALPSWVVCYIPATMSFLNILPSPKSFPFIVPYLLFENTMSVTKFNAMISGLLQLGGSYEWVVTKKSGRSSEGDLLSLVDKELKKPSRSESAPNLDALVKEDTPLKTEKQKKHNRIYRKELALAFLLLTAAARSLLSAQGIHFYFLLFQGISFLLVGLDLIGQQIE